MTDEAKRDRVRGALIGLAVGDAVGTTVEFKAPGTFPPVTDMVGGGRSVFAQESGPTIRRWRCVKPRAMHTTEWRAT